MMLYHFTFIGHLFPIFGWRCLDDETPPVAEGIKPTADAADPMAEGAPVVWLTSRPSLKPTLADLDWAKSPACSWSPKSIAGFCEQGTIADRTAMLTVELAPNSKRLRHVTAFCRPKVLKLMAPSACADWWAYFGTISADRIMDFSWTGAPSCNESEEYLKAAIDDARHVDSM
jgi:hypothetical protein